MDRAVAEAPLPTPAEGGAFEGAPVSSPRAVHPRPTFAEMYEAGFPFVWRNLLRLGVAPESVRDAAQDVFVVVHRRIDAYDGTATVHTWLFAIAMRVASQYRRSARLAAARSAPAPPESDPFERVVSHHPGPHEQAEARQANRLLFALLDELDDERRAVFVLTELEQMSAPEIAQALDLNLNTVYGRLRAARQQFNQALARYQARSQTRAQSRGRLP